MLDMLYQRTHAKCSGDWSVEVVFNAALFAISDAVSALVVKAQSLLEYRSADIVFLLRDTDGTSDQCRSACPIIQQMLFQRNS